MSQPKVCYIDDNKSNLLLVEKALSKSYDVSTLESPERSIEVLAELQPELILLDINMPEIDGYELCKKIKLEDQLKDTPIVFVTCRRSLEDRLTGFEAGADAYITKPFDITELAHVCAALITRRQQTLSAEKKAASSSDLAFMLMKNSGETGTLLSYARALAGAQNIESLAAETFAALEEFELNSTLLLNALSGDSVSRSDGITVTPLEVELMSLAQSGARIVNVGNKYLFRGQSCTFLIKNMPIEDEDLAGRLRDHLMIMLDLLDARMELINLRCREQSERQETADIAKVVIKEKFEKLVSNFSVFNSSSKKIFDGLAENIEESFIFMGLTEDQEKQLHDYVEEARADTERFQGMGAELRRAMEEITEQINRLA